MPKDDRTLTMADISSSDLKKIRDLEETLGGICLIAVEKQDALLVLEAKMGPNDWKPIDQVYPEIENLKAYYADEETARLSKGALKSFLTSSKEYKSRKRPIRIRKI